MLTVITVLIRHTCMCEKSWMCMWQWAHRHMSQDDFVYVFIGVWRQCLRAAQTKTDRERWQQPKNDCKPANSWVTSEVKCSNMLCSHTHFCMWADIYSPFPLPTPSSPRLLCPSVRTCHCHPAQPGWQHPCFVIPPPTGLHRSQEASLQPETCTGILPVPSVSAGHAYIHHTLDICVLLSFILAVVECVAQCTHTWTYAGIPLF